MAFIDLHVHTNASDGSMSPAEVVSYACEKGLAAIAVTDIDTVNGITPALFAARNLPIKVIPGVEVTSTLGGKELHILGYNVDCSNQLFLRGLKEITRLRDERNYKICSQLRTYGVDVDLESLTARMGCKCLNRSHFAAYLIAKGYVQDKTEASKKYLGKGAPCYIPLERVSAADAIKLIKLAGGLPVLAHPVKYRYNDDGYVQLFTILKGAGLQGIEAICPLNTAEEEAKFKKMAEDLDLFITGGSEFCGSFKPAIDLGTGMGNIKVPQTILKNICRE